MLRREFVVGGAAAGASVAAPDVALAQRPAKLEPVNIVCTAGTTQLLLTALMERMGYFAGLGLAPNIINVADGNKVVAALISGQADICPTSGFTQVLAAIGKGAPLRIIAGGAVKNFYALFSGNPEVKALKDLEGRAVGIGALGSQLHQVMIALCRKYGVDSGKIKFANVGASTDVFKAVVARTVDAGLAEVWLGRPGLHIVEHGKTYESLPEFVNQAAFSSERAMAEKREVVVRTLAAYAKAYRFIMSGNSEADFVAASVTALGKGDEDEARTQWGFYRQIQPFAADLVLGEDRVKFMQELNVLTGSETAVLPYAKVADMSLAREALRLV